MAPVRDARGSASLPPQRPVGAPAVTPASSDDVTADLRLGRSLAPLAPMPRERTAAVPDPAPSPPAPREKSGTAAAAAIVLAAVLVMGGLAVAGLQLLPPYTPGHALTAPAAPRPAPQPAGRRAAPAPAAYPCGVTSGHRVTIVDGAVPCGQALLVATQWLAYHATPGDGAGGAGTEYSWNCSARPGDGAACTSRSGGAMTVEPHGR